MLHFGGSTIHLASCIKDMRNIFDTNIEIKRKLIILFLDECYWMTKLIHLKHE